MSASMNETPVAQPWWKYGYVWLVIGGPAIVVVACCVTIWLTLTHPDPVIDENYYQHGLEINKVLMHPDLSMVPPRVKSPSQAANQPPED